MKKLAFKLKLFILIAPLSLAFVVFTLKTLNDNYQRKQNANHLLSAMATFKATSQLIDKMQIERGKTGLFLNDKLSPKDLAETRDNTDKAMEQVLKSFDPNNIFLSKLMGISSQELKSIRQDVDTKKVPAESFKLYSAFVASHLKKMVTVAHEYSFEGYEAQLLSLVLFEESKESLGKFRASLSGAISTGKPLSKDQTQVLETFRSGFVVNINSPGLKILPQSRESVDQLFTTTQWKDLMVAYEDVTSNFSTGTFNSDPKKVFENATYLIEEIYKQVIFEFDHTKSDVTEITQKATIEFFTYLSVGLILLTLVLSLSFWTIRSIIRDMMDVEEKLRKAIKSTTQATVDLKDSSNSLASGVQEQSSALQQSVSALEEIKSMVEKSVETTHNAKTFMDNSNNEAVQAQHIMKVMVESIDKIKEGNDNFNTRMNENNQKLNEIIRVISEIEGKTKIINDIVFQTKLLSFNASVEAARAGEHGKGFSVVADEVGKLATLSGDAAKGISELLKDGITSINNIIARTQETVVELVKESDKRIQEGVTNADSCREAFERITVAINEIDHLMESISAASNEQFKGIEEINSAMTQLDLVTQNSSMSANMTSYSAVSLESQASSLNEIVHSLSEFVHGKSSQNESKMAS